MSREQITTFDAIAGLTFEDLTAEERTLVETNIKVLKKGPSIPHSEVRKSIAL